MLGTRLHIYEVFIFCPIYFLQSFDLYEVNLFLFKNYQKNRRMRLIIVEKHTHQPTKNRRRRLMIKQNVGDGLARLARLARPVI